MLRAIAEYSKNNRAEFVRTVQETQGAQQASDISKKKKRLAAASGVFIMSCLEIAKPRQRGRGLANYFRCAIFRYSPGNIPVLLRNNSASLLGLE